MVKRQTPWQKDPVIMARLPKVEERLLDGWGNNRIAAELGVDEATIRRDRQRLSILWQQAVGKKVVRMRAQSQAKLEHAQRQAMEGYKRAMAEGKPVPVDKNDPSAGFVSFAADLRAAASFLSVFKQAQDSIDKLHGTSAGDRSQIELNDAVRREAERLSSQLGVPAAELLAEAKKIMGGG